MWTHSLEIDMEKVCYDCGAFAPSEYRCPSILDIHNTKCNVRLCSSCRYINNGYCMGCKADFESEDD